MEELAPPLTNNVAVAIVVNGAPLFVFIDGVNAPITAGNFVDLVERGFYDGITFHRVEPGFVVQAGDPNSRDPNFPPELLGLSGFTDPVTGVERNIPLEIAPLGGTPLLDQLVPPPVQIPHLRGTISMARATPLDSASSQFFIGLNDVTVQSLDGRFAAFGSLFPGFDVVLDSIQQGDRISTARVVDGFVPTRSSAIVTDGLLLSNFVNAINFSQLGLGFGDLSDAADAVQITPEATQLNPSGVRGFGGNDNIVGSEGFDIINGNTGNDTVAGGVGVDYLRGGQNEDMLFGGEGDDILNGNKGNDFVAGDGGNDFVRGGQANDTLLGGDGNDVIVGDFGADVLSGGAGADTFLFRTATAGDLAATNTIVDFNAAEGDRLVVVGDIPANDLLFVNSGANTLVQLATGATLGVIQNVTNATVQATTTIAPSFDLAISRIA